MKPFSQGLAGATGIERVPTCGNQAANAEQMNSASTHMPVIR
jgi:hypothetical protein